MNLKQGRIIFIYNASSPHKIDLMQGHGSDIK